MTSDSTSATLITLVYMCILLPMASEAMAASKRPRRSHLTSKFNSVTSITYVPMSLWLLNASIHLILPEEEGYQLSSIDLRGFAAGKNILRVVDSYCVGVGRLNETDKSWSEPMLPIGDLATASK